MVKSDIGEERMREKNNPPLPSRSLQHQQCRKALHCLLVLLFVCTYLTAFSEAASVNGDNPPDGSVSQVTLPQDQRLHNKGGSDGAGLCVFTSIDHSARVGNVPALVGFRDWMTKRPGGGYPQKVDQMIQAICKERGVPVPAYVQVEGDDLEVLQKACESGRMPAITYSVSPTKRYNGQWIAHMVSLTYSDGTNWGILDNNYEKEIEWLNTTEFKRSYYGKAKGWAVILINPGLPPDPKNVKVKP